MKVAGGGARSKGEIDAVLKPTGSLPSLVPVSFQVAGMSGNQPT